MKKLLFIAIAFVAFTGFSQSKYEQGMEKAFDLWKNNQPWEAANLFERIAQAEPDNWLPPFYVAQINVIYSFTEKDEDKLTAQLKKAQDFLNDAKAISKDNAEILVVQAQLYTAWVVFDGAKYGMTMSPKINQLYQEAYKLEPENPRAAFGKVEWELGTARWFGQDTKPFCEDLKKAVALFDTYEPKGQYYPQGGGEYAQQSLAQNCKEE
ncbi:hypothetical protein KXJ69_08935 [Aureisphaera sp. CAU 1614]|uniref:Tetratricopeptide repeat protein n=1 Tax=Halomarinibacterium sedimenti TaxID=2857106 RepID=A0A9X1FPV7_9FLAO|nr:hypothetical protein [Halomarinibacterium sedimenti]MBW2938228.1 hypothetical protein [Halomarinibacterium sedimenti]